MSTSPRIDRARLIGRLDSFNRIGALPGGGNCRLALSDEDRAGRDLLVQWMRDLDLTDEQVDEYLAQHADEVEEAIRSHGRRGS